jgi:hypothetical protein
VTVTAAEAAAVLYRTVLSLPAPPSQQACPAIAGPRYTLAFFATSRPVLSATADSSGCGTVTLSTDDVRQASTMLWQLVQRDIADAAAPAQVWAVTVVTFAPGDQPATTQTVAAAGRAQSVYDALRALPATRETRCPAIAGPRYALDFATSGASLRASADRGGCGSAQFEQGSPRAATTRFWQVVDAALAGVTSAPAVPASVRITVEPTANDPSVAASARLLRGQPIIQHLYAAISALPAMPAGVHCPAPSGPRYAIDFLLDDGVAMLDVIADAGGCGTVTFDQGEVRQANQAIWRLLSEALSA